jgi:hypothetical protein
MTTTIHQGKGAGPTEDGGAAATVNERLGANAPADAVMVIGPGAELGTVNVHANAPFKLVEPEQRGIVEPFHTTL